MSEHRGQRKYTSALRFSFLTPIYDLAIRLFTREKTWRQALVQLLDVSPDDRILDVGCGTGSLAVALKQLTPECEVVGLDPDPQVLEIAKKKASAAGVEIEWQEGFLDDFPLATDLESLEPESLEPESLEPESLEPVSEEPCTSSASNSCGEMVEQRNSVSLISPQPLGRISKVVSSLVLHQTSLETKKTIFRRAFELLPDGGMFCIADYGVQRSRAMKLMFKLVVQTIDGKKDTQPNANGFLTEGLVEAGFCQVHEVKSYSTLTGSISLISARKPLANRNSSS